MRFVTLFSGLGLAVFSSEGAAATPPEACTEAATAAHGRQGVAVDLRPTTWRIR